MLIRTSSLSLVFTRSSQTSSSGSGAPPFIAPVGTFGEHFQSLRPNKDALVLVLTCANVKASEFYLVKGQRGWKHGIVLKATSGTSSPHLPLSTPCWWELGRLVCLTLTLTHLLTEQQETGFTGFLL